eukprot:scaffold9357_cov62-Cyclotella_meneghiniana.AAC.1
MPFHPLSLKIINNCSIVNSSITPIVTRGGSMPSIASRKWGCCHDSVMELARPLKRISSLNSSSEDRLESGGCCGRAVGRTLQDAAAEAASDVDEAGLVL